MSLSRQSSHRMCPVIAITAIAFSSGIATGEDAISFSRDVLPILSEKCFQCHGPDEEQRQADLRLDEEQSVVEILNRPDGHNSELLRRIETDDADEIMPPADSNLSLTIAQKATLRQWLMSGSQWGKHWSFEPLMAPPIPEPVFPDVPIVNPVDNFVQARLQESALSPSAEADRSTLLRRVTLDLTGLPPTLQEQQAYVDDIQPGSYERAVDRLMASTAYGERMAWDWLNAARYADSNGYQGDRDRTMWPWREWVVKAFNQNMPFDEFTINQLAGDLLPNATFEQKIATGFCRNHMINGEGGRIPDENRVDYVMDMSETMGTVWLGLTLNCCRCHDHKFDPLKQQDYYQFYAYFNQTPVTGSGGDPQTAPTIAVPSATDQQQLATIESQIGDATDDEQRKKLTQQRDDINKRVPKVMIMEDQPERRGTFILSRGLYNGPTDHKVVAATPTSLPGDTTDTPQNRLDLAKWLVAADNPLPARVTVNRFWQQIMGQGLVKTTEDFGVQGEYPVQKDLLDWLAADFRDNGWDVKQLVRMIVTSHTYRQSSTIRTVTNTNGERISEREIDPDNRLLARSSRFRLPSFVLRDQALASCGLLNPKVGGPPIHTYQPVGVWAEPTFGNKKHAPSGGDSLYRRSLYIFWRRIVAPTVFFDNASRQTCMVKALRTNTPMHSLLTLNETTYVESARTLAQQLLVDESLDDEKQLGLAYRCIVCREITPEESVVMLGGLKRSRMEFTADIESAVALLCVGDSQRNESLDSAEHAAWTSLCLAILNLDETLTRE
jgi:hypothetical protein